MITLSAWAIRWGIPMAALVELQQYMGLLDPAPEPQEGRSEAAVTNDVRLEASRQGMRLWRNNVGQLNDENGRPVRYGLANDSPQVNKVMKSADLIGIRPVLVTRAHEGQTIGQFVSIECKAEGWRYAGTPREEAQQNWATLVLSLGGDARFICKRGAL
jgi:hypothetical protein